MSERGRKDTEAEIKKLESRTDLSPAEEKKLRDLKRIWTLIYKDRGPTTVKFFTVTDK